jgi:O-antigen/teichoic acid export membrane protein
VLARAADAPSVGDVALATALSTPAVVILDGGLAQYLVREADGEGRLPAAVRAALRRRTVALIVLPVLVAAGTALFGDTSDSALIGLLVGASASFEGAAQSWLAGPRSRGNMRPDAIFKGVYGTVTLAVVAIAWAAGGLTGLLAAAATAGGAAVAAALAARHLPRARWVERSLSDARAGRRFFQTTLLTSLFLSADVLIVGAILGSAKLAPYALATKLIGALAVLPIATLRVSLSWAARGEGPSARDEVRTGARLGLAIAVAGVAAGPFVASILFGHGYAHAMTDPLRLLALNLFVVAIQAPLVGRHLGAGDTVRVTRAAALTLALALVLIPVGTLTIGTAGAALGVLLAQLGGSLPYVSARAHDGWSLRDLVPSVPAAAVSVAAGVAALWLPPLSAATLAAAAVAVLAGAGVSFRAARRYSLRTP